MGLCRELRKGNVFLICIRSRPLQCTQYPTFFILRFPWMYRTCWSRHRKSQRLEISLCDSSFLPLPQRKRKESHCWTAVTRGPGISVVFLQGAFTAGLQETGLSAEDTDRRGRASTFPEQDPAPSCTCPGAWLGSEPELTALCWCGQRRLHWPCRHHGHPEWIRSSAND